MNRLAYLVEEWKAMEGEALVETGRVNSLGPCSLFLS